MDAPHFNTMKTSAQKILERPVAEWPLAILSQQGKTVGALQDVENELAALVQRAALLHAYLAHRYNTGCGDQGHKASAKYANTTLVQVRRALGFSYPKNTPLTIQP